MELTQEVFYSRPDLAHRAPLVNEQLGRRCEATAWTPDGLINGPEMKGWILFLGNTFRSPSEVNGWANKM